MLQWALLFFVVAVVAALVGLRGVAGLSAEVGYVLAVLAVVFLVIAMVSNAFAEMEATPPLVSGETRRPAWRTDAIPPGW